MHRTCLVSILVSLFLVSTSVFPNAFPEISLQKKVEQSTLVVIGKVKATTSYDAHCLAQYKCADVKVTEVLKGVVYGRVIVLFGGEYTEANPLCCEVGTSYLFLVTRVSGDYYATVNGPFGIYKVP